MSEKVSNTHRCLPVPGAAGLTLGQAASLIALVAGATYALCIFQIPFIMGHGVYWDEPYGDQITARIGTLYFIRDAWRFPLLFVPKLSFPQGANTVFTDNIPLLALISKIVYKLSGEWFNYLGLWTFLCFPFLAAFAARSAREAGSHDLIAILGTALIALACPALLYRGMFAHIGLMAQFLIAWGILLYFRLHNAPRSRSAIIQFCAAVASALLLQAYFLPMVLLFLIAALAQCVIEGRLTKVRAALNFTAVMAVAIATAWIAGIIGPGSRPPSAGGYGFFSMNALSPFLPPRDHWPEWLAGYVQWEGLEDTWDATGGQYEGYNYLGAGVLLLAVIHLIWSRRLIAEAIKRHAFLVLMLAACCVYALSNKVYVGNWLVINFRLPRSLVEVTSFFRTGGRLFWPVYYVLVVGVVCATWRRFSLPTARAVIIAAVAIQLIDTQSLRTDLTAATSKGFPQKIADDQWRPLLSAHRFFKQYPSFQCGGWAGKWPENSANLELLWLVAKLDMPTNSAYLNRPNTSCADERREGLKFDLQAGGLYVYGNAFGPSFIERLPSFRDWCRKFDYGVVCSTNWDRIPQLTAPPWTAISADPNLVCSGGACVRRISIDPSRQFEINLREGGNGALFTDDHWYEPEQWGQWTDATQATVAFSIDVPRDVYYTLSVRALVSASAPKRSVWIAANQCQIGGIEYDLAHAPGLQIISGMIPRSCIDADGTIVLRITTDRALSPKEIGVSNDTRTLGAGIERILIHESTGPSPDRPDGSGGRGLSGDTKN